MTDLEFGENLSMRIASARNANTPVEIVEKYDCSFTIIEILLAAAEEDLCYDIKSFDQAYQAVTKNGMIPYIAAGIFATPQHQYQNNKVTE